MTPNTSSKNKILPFNLGGLTEFPFINETFDSITEYEILEKLSKKLNEVICFTNNVLDKKLIEYIDKRFNDMIIDTMYEPETETLVLFLNDAGGGE